MLLSSRVGSWLPFLGSAEIPYTEGELEGQAFKAKECGCVYWKRTALGVSVGTGDG